MQGQGGLEASWPFDRGAERASGTDADGNVVVVLQDPRRGIGAADEIVGALGDDHGERAVRDLDLSVVVQRDLESHAVLARLERHRAGDPEVVHVRQLAAVLRGVGVVQVVVEFVVEVHGQRPGQAPRAPHDVGCAAVLGDGLGAGGFDRHHAHVDAVRGVVGHRVVRQVGGLALRVGDRIAAAQGQRARADADAVGIDVVADHRVGEQRLAAPHRLEQGAPRRATHIDGQRGRAADAHGRGELHGELDGLAGLVGGRVLGRRDDGDRRDRRGRRLRAGELRGPQQGPGSRRGPDDSKRPATQQPLQHPPPPPPRGAWRVRASAR